MKTARFRPIAYCHHLDKRNVSPGWFAGSIVVWVLMLFTGWEPAASACAPDGTVRVVVGSKTTIGRPIAMSNHEIVMMRRDGRIVEFAKRDWTSASEISTVFTPYTSSKIQAHLQGLFGKRYEVSRTAQYVVVHPRGLRQQWADPFEALYNRFTQYFAARRYTLTTP